MSGHKLNKLIRDFVIVIPARMHGTRLPGKPLVRIAGKAMIHHVWDRCALVYPPENIFIATEDAEIENYCNLNRLQCVTTPKANSAIDRIYLFSKQVEAQTYINVQGDEPIVNPKDIETIVKYALANRNNVVFGKTMATKSDFEDYSKAKVVCDLEGRLLYSSRAGIPINNKGEFVEAERAIWIYGFPALSLSKYYESYGSTNLDEIEDNEILRFLEVGEPVYCVDVIGDSWAVDEFKDIAIVESKMKALKS